MYTFDLHTHCVQLKKLCFEKLYKIIFALILIFKRSEVNWYNELH